MVLQGFSNADRSAADTAHRLRTTAVRWLLAAIVLGASQAGAQLPGLGSEPAPAPVQQIPDPRNLKPDWWSYVANAGDELDQRGENLRQSIDQAVLSLAVADADGVSELAERARRGIQAYIEEAAKQPQGVEATLRTGGTFTLNELLETQRTLWTTGIERREQSDRVRQGRAMITSGRRRLDQFIQTYHGGSLDPAAKLRSGVELIAERAELALDELRISRRQGYVEQLDTYEKQLESQLAYARKNLQAGAWEGAGPEETLERLGRELGESRKVLALHRDKMLTIDESDIAGRVNAVLIRQEVLASLATQASSRLALANFKAQRMWYRIHDPEDPASSSELRSALAEFQSLLTEVRGEFDAWQRANEAVLLEAPVVPAESRELELKAMDQRARTLALETLRQIRMTRGAAAGLSLMVAILGEDLAAVQGGVRGWLERARLAVLQVWNQGARLLDEPLFHVAEGENPVTAISLLRVLVILLITYLLSVVTRKGLNRIGERRGVSDAHSLYAVGRLLHYLLISVGLFLGLSTLGLDLGNLALIAGALSVGIGFGLQATVSNFVSGLILLFDRSLKVGDYVELDSGYKGTVQEVTVRATRINTNDNVDVLVPNSEFVSTKLTNWTLKEPFARLRIPFGVAYGSDKQKVHDVALEAAKRVDLTLYHMAGREPQVRLIGFGDSSLDFELLVWVSRSGVKRPGRSRAAYYWELETGLAEAGIEIPFPQRDLHLKSGMEGVCREGRRPFRGPRRRQ